VYKLAKKAYTTVLVRKEHAPFKLAHIIYILERNKTE